MANQLYGYSHNNYGTSTSSSASLRSAADTFLASNRYLRSDPLSLLSNNSASMYYNTSGDNAGNYAAGTGTYAAATTASWPGVDGSAALENLKRTSEALYHQSVLSAHNTIGQTEAWFTANSLVKRPRFESTSNLPIYPQRPGEKDCAHYMLTRTCKFGDTCRFDHPIWVPEGGIPDWKEVPLIATEDSLPERPGEPDCPYFVKTQRCKFGLRCKFNHPRDKMIPLSVLENAEVSLPERPSEPPCAFYMKTGICKFGPTCKFNHPKDIQILQGEQENGHNGQTDYGVNHDGSTGHASLVKPIITPALLHNTKGLPVRLGEVDCPFYLKTGSCKYGSTCRYNHPDRYAINPVAAALGQTYIASPAAHLSMGMVNPAASILQTIDPRLTHASLVPAIYPQRPGHPECDFYMKTGECKFVDRCKYHHPYDRSAPSLAMMEAQNQSIKLSLAGLPRREGAIICPYYLKTGTCKYGPTCKFDHPPPAEVMSMSTTQSGTVEGKEEGEEQQ